MTTQEIVEKNRALVNQYYPGLSNSNTWEWNHKIAFLSWLESKGLVGQKSTTPTSPVSEDTIGILTHPLVGLPGQNFYPFTFEAVDLRNGSNGAMQWLSFGLVSQNFIIPTVADVSLIPSQPNPGKTVPWIEYNENGFQRLKNMVAHDYGRRPQGPDYDVSVWSGRYFHNCYMGPDGIPLGEQKALERVKPELCASLGIPLADPDGTIYYGN